MGSASGMLRPMGTDRSRSQRHAEDLDLVRRYLAGEAAARHRVAERLASMPGILVAAHRRMGSPLSRGELDDLAQDSVVRVLEKLPTFAGLATIETWAFRICHWELMNRRRRKQRRREGQQPSADEVPEPVAPSAVPPEEYDHLDRALTELGPPAEDIIRLKHFRGLTFEQIAETLDLSPSTAKTRYYRGMRWLRDRLQGEEEPS